MFDIGFWELFILFGLGLVVLGPEKLPKVAMQVGNWAGQARRMARTLTTQMRAELDTDITKPFTTGYSPNKASSYKRPGVDDLKPGEADNTIAESAAESEAEAPQSSVAADSTSDSK